VENQLDGELRKGRQVEFEELRERARQSIRDGIAVLLLISAPTLAACAFTGGSAAEPTGVATAILTWEAPKTNTDGTPITNLAGYTIYYGRGWFRYTVNISGASTTTYAVQKLASGTWEFSVSAYTASGSRSAPSKIVSKTIP
jgi:hypothetical protein